MKYKYFQWNEKIILKNVKNLSDIYLWYNFIIGNFSEIPPVFSVISVYDNYVIFYLHNQFQFSNLNICFTSRNPVFLLNNHHNHDLHNNMSAVVDPACKHHANSHQRVLFNVNHNYSPPILKRKTHNCWISIYIIRSKNTS